MVSFSWFVSLSAAKCLRMSFLQICLMGLDPEYVCQSAQQCTLFLCLPEDPNLFCAHQCTRGIQICLKCSTMRSVSVSVGGFQSVLCSPMHPGNPSLLTVLHKALWFCVCWRIPICFVLTNAPGGSKSVKSAPQSTLVLCLPEDPNLFCAHQCTRGIHSVSASAGGFQSVLCSPMHPGNPNL